MAGKVTMGLAEDNGR